MFAQGRLKEGTLCPCTRKEPGCPYTNLEHADARLTDLGRMQAARAGAALLHTTPVPQVVFVSPLFRTLQTATIALSTIPTLAAPLIACEEVRERYGQHVCDRRSRVEDVAGIFPTVHFARVQKGDDPLFDGKKESVDEAAERGKGFFLSLMERPETSIGVVTHSSFLFNTISRRLETPDPKGTLTLRPIRASMSTAARASHSSPLTNTSSTRTVARRFATGEVRCVVLTYEQK